jgi:cobyrinic acid a,c-diamide synthase
VLVGVSTPPEPEPAPVVGPAETSDLHHHGDREVGDGLVDFAVNVHRGPRPTWLDAALHGSLEDLHRYPDPTAATAAIAARHHRDAAEVLPTAGGAEAFTLLARLRRWRRPVVVHPQFTEPEAALRAAGHAVTRVLLRAADGFALDPALVPDDSDLVVVGNPCNPTGALTRADLLAGLCRPGRTVVVDEAFMDAVPGEPESLAGSAHPGLVVVRSLTKTWSLPGVRAGYLLADPDTAGALAAQQPPWSVGATAAAAMVACSGPDAAAEADRRAAQVARHRRHLVDGLAALGLEPAGDPVTPFVLVCGPAHLHGTLRDHGIAVRRGDTFPGLGPGWVRIAVRDPATTDLLLDALAGACVPG